MPAPPGDATGAASETARLTARIRELEQELRRERAHRDGLARGVTALSERVAALRKDTSADRRPRVTTT
jgi:phage shock protein A